MKKFIKIICALSCLVIVMSGCSKKEADDYSEAQLKECFDAEIHYSTGISQDEYRGDKVVLVVHLAKDAKESWADLKEVCGTYQGENGDYDISISNGEITLTQQIKGSKRDVIATATFEKDPENENKMTMTSLSYEALYSLGEKLEQAGMNTILGMGTVFIVLIFISRIISSFSLIPKLTASRKKKKSDQNMAAVTEEVMQKESAPKAPENETENPELIAVIAAAISASEEISTDSFVVRSIRRRY